MDWKQLVRGVAPTLAGMLASPAAGAATKILADALLGGSSGDAVADEAKLAGVLAGGLTPEIRLRLIDAEAEAKRQVFELRKLTLQYNRERERDELTDVEGARSRDKALREGGRGNDRADRMFWIAVGFIGLLTVLVWADSSLDDFAKSTVTLILGRFLGYVDDVYKFEFGTTRNNRAKDATIEQLSRAKERE